MPGLLITKHKMRGVRICLISLNVCNKDALSLSFSLSLCECVSVRVCDSLACHKMHWKCLQTWVLIPFHFFFFLVCLFVCLWSYFDRSTDSGVVAKQSFTLNSPSHRKIGSGLNPIKFKILKSYRKNDFHEISSTLLLKQYCWCVLKAHKLSL